MKKLVLAMLTMFAFAGLTIAGVALVVKIDEKEKTITLKEEGKDEKTYKWTDDTVIKFGDKEVKVSEKTFSRIKAGTSKIDFEADGDKIKSFKFVGGKKKDKTDK